MSGRPAGGTTRMATAAAGTETPAAMPKQHDAAGKVEAVRTVTTTIVQDVRIADTAAGSGIPAAILRLPAVGGRTVADKQGCVRPSGRAHRRLAATCKNCCATRPRRRISSASADSPSCRLLAEVHSELRLKGPDRDPRLLNRRRNPIRVRTDRLGFYYGAFGVQTRSRQLPPRQPSYHRLVRPFRLQTMVPHHRTSRPDSTAASARSCRMAESMFASSEPHRPSGFSEPSQPSL